MRLKRICVFGLFGRFDYEINLNMTDRITILHGPNGFGKTTILRMVHDLFCGRYAKLMAIKFRDFRIDFEDGRSIAVTRPDTAEDSSSLVVTLMKGQEVLQSLPLKETDPDTIRHLGHFLERRVPGLVREATRRWRFLPTGEVFTTEGAVSRFAHLLPSEFSTVPVERDWLRVLKKDVNIRFIESQRLFRSPQVRHSDDPERIQPMVSVYSKELIDTIRSKLAEYATLSQTLDRTFPRRVVEQIENEGPGAALQEDVRPTLAALEQKRSQLKEAGLLDKQEDLQFQVPENLQETTQRVLRVYVHDTEQKFSVFDDLAKRIELFSKIVNERFFFKTMSVSRDRGITFRADEGTDIDLTDLSTGEQHMLVLLYELLFLVTPDSLVMVDEPEISLHVAWQQGFLGDLAGIIDLSRFDVLIATHSPQIIHDRWDLTVELSASGNLHATQPI